MNKISEKINEYKGRVKEWVINNADTKAVQAGLAVVSFTESSFFLVPPDLLLIPIILVNKGRRWIYYVSLTTITSVLGGALGYLIGLYFFDTFGEMIVRALGLEKELIYVGELFRDNAFWAIFTAAFTPIPYKIFTIGAGLFKIDFFVFIIASIIGRGMRFFLVGYITATFGERATELVLEYFSIVVYSILAIIAVYLSFKFFS